MFDIGFGEMIMLAAIALIAIGPKQLPDVARSVGKLIGEFKRTVGDVTSTVANARAETDKAIRSVTDDLADSIRQAKEIRPVKDKPYHPPMDPVPSEPAGNVAQTAADSADSNTTQASGDDPGSSGGSRS